MVDGIHKLGANYRQNLRDSWVCNLLEKYSGGGAGKALGRSKQATEQG